MLVVSRNYGQKFLAPNDSNGEPWIPRETFAARKDISQPLSDNPHPRRDSGIFGKSDEGEEWKNDDDTDDRRRKRASIRQLSLHRREAQFRGHVCFLATRKCSINASRRSSTGIAALRTIGVSFRVSPKRNFRVRPSGRFHWEVGLNLSAAPLDSTERPELLLQGHDDPPGWRDVCNLVGAMETHQTKSLRRPIEVGTPGEDNSWV
jgi:hypothetical protein